MTALEAQEQHILDAFINGLHNTQIRQRLLENTTLTLKTAYEQAYIFESAIQQSSSYLQPDTVGAAFNPSIPTTPPPHDDSPTKLQEQSVTAALKSDTSYFCGLSKHLRVSCPARGTRCHKCGKLGHFSKVCKSSKTLYKATRQNTSATLAASPGCLSKTIVKVKINGRSTNALLDTGSLENFIKESLVKTNKFYFVPSPTRVTMANVSAQVTSYCLVDLLINDVSYKTPKLSVIKNLCCEIILGHNFLQQHSQIEIPFGGSMPALKICGLATAKIQYPSLFENLTENCKPIAVRSRRFSYNLIIIKIHWLRWKDYSRRV